MRYVNVAVIVGSNRRDSINRKLARALVKMADGKLTARFIQIDNLPMYSQDIEEPLPASVGRFKAELERAELAPLCHAGAQPLSPRCPQERH